jgi:hypothetical protein
MTSKKNRAHPRTALRSRLLIDCCEPDALVQQCLAVGIEIKEVRTQGPKSEGKSIGSLYYPLSPKSTCEKCDGEWE